MLKVYAIRKKTEVGFRTYIYNSRGIKAVFVESVRQPHGNSKTIILNGNVFKVEFLNKIPVSFEQFEKIRRNLFEKLWNF